MVIDILVLIVLFVTNTIQAITGFAGTLLAMPPTIKLIGPDEAKLLLTLVAQISCALIVITGYKKINWKVFLRMLVLMVVGMAIGMKIYEIFPMRALLIFYGIMIIIIAVAKLTGAGKSVKLPEWMYFVIIFAAGIIHGMFSSGGALLVVYATYALKEKEEFRATMAMLWVTVGFYLSGVQISRGFMNSHVIFLLLAGLIPVFVGTYIGTKLVKKIDQQVFLKITYVLLIISGLLAIV